MPRVPLQCSTQFCRGKLSLKMVTLFEAKTSECWCVSYVCFNAVSIEICSLFVGNLMTFASCCSHNIFFSINSFLVVVNERHAVFWLEICTKRIQGKGRHIWRKHEWYYGHKCHGNVKDIGRFNRQVRYVDAV